MFEKIFIISFLVIGYCCTFWPGMIFEKLGDWCECNLPEWINKPTWHCYICCCMWIGSAAYWIIWGNSIKEWLITCIGAMGVNAFISELTDKTHKIEIEE